jgi:hypothetical protein
LLGLVIGKYVKRTNVVAGLCDKKIVAPMIFQGSCNTEFFVKWVKEQLVPSLTVGQVVVWIMRVSISHRRFKRR